MAENGISGIAVLANAFGVLSALAFVISFQIRSNRRLFAVQALANVFYALQFLLLGAAGVAGCERGFSGW